MKTYYDWLDLTELHAVDTDRDFRPPELLWYQEFFLGSGQPAQDVDNLWNNESWYLCDPIEHYPGGALDGISDHEWETVLEWEWVEV